MNSSVFIVEDVRSQLMPNIFQHLLNKTHISIGEMFQAIGVIISIISDRIKKIGKVTKLGKWVPHNVTESQRARRFEVCSMLFLKNLSQSLDPDEPNKYFPKLKLHEQKIMVTLWWPTFCVVYKNLRESDQNITVEVYSKQLNEMHVRLSKIRPLLFNRQGPILLPNNPDPHVRKTLQKFTD